MTVRYIAEDGTPITQAMLDEWIEEADNGHPNSVFEPLTAEEKAKRNRVIAMSTHSVRVADSVWNLAKKEASTQGISMSTFMREALMEKIIKTRNTELLATA